MRKLLIALLILLTPFTAHALDKKIGATNSFILKVYDISSKMNEKPASITLTYNTDYVVKVKCFGDSVTQVDGTGDTFTWTTAGLEVTTNDAITSQNEDECTAWTEGAGAYAGMIAKTPVKFKAVGATIDMGIGTYSGAVVSSADCTNSQTVFDTDLAQTQTDHWKDAWLTFQTGVLAGSTRPITAFNATTKCISIRSPGFSTTPSEGDTFVIINK